MSYTNSSKKNKVALIDCNSFYVSCERLFNPKINNKPTVVLSNNDGCVISRSTEAKKIGIKMGEPYFKVKELVKKNDVNIIPMIVSSFNPERWFKKSIVPAAKPPEIKAPKANGKPSI